MREWRCVGTRVQAGPTEVRAGFTTRRLLEFTILIEADDAQAAGKEFRLATGVPPDLVGNRAVAGVCEGCKRLIFGSEVWYSDPTHTLLSCGACGHQVGKPTEPIAVAASRQGVALA